MQLRFTPPALARGALLSAATLLCTLASTDCVSSSAVDGSDGLLAARFSPTSSRRIRVRATRDEILSFGEGTYIGRCLVDRDSILDRWPVRIDRPLRVWIDSGQNHSVRADYPAIVAGAFNEWAATGIPLRFEFVNRPRDAEVRVRWADYLPGKTGSTTWRTDRDGWLQSSDITLATHVSDGHPLDGGGVRVIALHEIGHALGLSHSSSGHDIMAPIVRVNGLSAADLATIRLLYELPAGHVR